MGSSGYTLSLAAGWPSVEPSLGKVKSKRNENDADVIIANSSKLLGQSAKKWCFYLTNWSGCFEQFVSPKSVGRKNVRAPIMSLVDPKSHSLFLFLSAEKSCRRRAAFSRPCSTATSPSPTNQASPSSSLRSRPCWRCSTTSTAARTATSCDTSTSTPSWNSFRSPTSSCCRILTGSFPDVWSDSVWSPIRLSGSTRKASRTAIRFWTSKRIWTSAPWGIPRRVAKDFKCLMCYFSSIKNGCRQKSTPIGDLRAI